MNGAPRQAPNPRRLYIRSKFRDLDRRLQGMEHYVTSPRFDLDQEFRDLE